VIVVDANLLLYAYHAGAPEHEAARRWWEDSLSAPEPIRLPWVTALAFLRSATHPRVFRRPLEMAEARAHVDSWLVRPMVDWIEPGPRHWQILSELLEGAQIRANLTTDAHLAALAIEFGATLASSDRDFTRFAPLKLLNPLRG
jgi:toxin-antitoxin system PIN domain toxin